MLFVATPDTMAGAGYTLVAATCDDLPPYALTPREQREFDELPHAARRHDWLAGRNAAKRAIGARWGIAPDRIELASIPGGPPRPYIQDRAGHWSPLPGRLTIAHRDGAAIAVAFPSTSSIGVDLERAAEVSPRELRYIASAQECAWLEGVDPSLVWILKEAAWKALRLHPTTPLSSLQLVCRPGTDELIAVRYGIREFEARAIVGHLRTGQSLVAAVVEIAPEVS